MSQGGEEHGHEEHVHDEHEHVEHGHEEEAQAGLSQGSVATVGSPSWITSHQRKPWSHTKWPTNIKHVGEVNENDLPLYKEINIRLSRVCGLGARQRVSLTLERFDDLTKNDKNKLFDNSIQAYIEYPEEMKEKGKKLAMKIISHA
jgi:hypothetical protein